MQFLINLLAKIQKNRITFDDSVLKNIKIHANVITHQEFCR